MTEFEPKADLQRYLQTAREALLWNWRASTSTPSAAC